MKRFAGSTAIAVAALSLAGCSGGNSDTTVSGTVVAVSGSEISVLDSEGTKVADVLADQSGIYELDISEDVAYPLTFLSKGGVAVATNENDRIDLVGVSFDAEIEHVNLSPLGTLTTWVAECSGSHSEESIEAAWQMVDSQLGMGTGGVTDPMHELISTDNVASVVLANAVFGEAVRRTSVAVSATGRTFTTEEVMRQIACDLQLDGSVNGVGAGSSDVLAAIYRAAEASVLIEAIAGQLHIDGHESSTELQAVIDAMVGAGQASLTDVVIGPEAVTRAQNTLSVLILHFSDAEVVPLLIALGSDASDVPSELAAAFDTALMTTLWAMPERVALTDAVELAELTDRMEAQGSEVPIVSVGASTTLVEQAGSIQLSWASAHAERCYAYGGWEGEVDLEGSATIDEITVSTEFGLECVGLGGSSRDDILVAVVGADGTDAGEGSAGATGPDAGTAPSQAVPEVNLTAARLVVAQGEATNLVWTASNADQCEASGDWAGSRVASGTESTGPIDGIRTYVLTCYGGGGSGEATVTVEANAAAAPEPPPPPEPTVSLTASAQNVAAGGTVTLSWNSTNATACTADGGWNGARATAGNETLGPITASTTYSLSCSGAGGSAIAMLSVNVAGSISLSWEAPTENVDGSPVVGLAGYKIYYGVASRQYEGSVVLDDPDATGHTFALPGGTYYLAMTALSGDGEESAYSNEVLKSTAL